jgi:hypothetical protein
VLGRGRKGTGTTALVLVDGRQTPLGVIIAPANEHEVRHIERLVDSAVVDLPEGQERHRRQDQHANHCPTR